MNDYFDRFGNPMPDDWWDKAKYGSQFRSWQTDKRVGNTVVGDYTVSTVWLGLDHRHGPGDPLIFETMVFGGQFDQELTRYSTEEEAMRGHLDVLDRLREGRPPFSYLEDGDE